jgi:arabinofuranan 3-O-arabinosyltransferase
MAASRSTLSPAPEQTAIPAWLVRVCLVLAVANVTLCGVAYFSHWWVYDPRSQN